MSDSESSRAFLLTRYGTRLYSLDNAIYEAEAAHALKSHELEPDEVAYAAHATSPLLKQYGWAVAFEARIENIGKPDHLYSPFAVASFTLVLLDEDFKKTSSHRAEMDSLGGWVIGEKESAIAVRNRVERKIITEIRKGYLLDRPDDPLDAELRGLVSRTEPQETPPLSQQRSHWHLPVQGE